MTAADTEQPRGQMRVLNHHIVTGAVSAVGALLVVTDAADWQEGVVLAAGLAAAVFALTRWTEGRAPLWSLPYLVVTAAVWVAGVLVFDGATASYPLAIVGAILVHDLPRHRRATAVGLVAGALAVVAVRLVLAPEDAPRVLFEYVVVAGIVGGSAAILPTLDRGVSALATQLEESREREAELAVVRERMRFASELHDIQGHTLHVVKLKIALARKLLHTDTERADEELREVYALVGDTIAQTKDLAYAKRRLNLSAELENAKNLLEAAGSRVRVDREGEVDERVDEMLGQILRETTTNILRHAQARQVHITLSETGIAVDNDGAPDAAATELRGLAILQQRVAYNGGELTVEQQNGRFRTAAVFPQADPDTARSAAAQERDR
ncbi:two-component system sensor histidine kinase DesK [Lipingzhangella halophila]|uniref:Two-component system sensor histidine kinase DesK n=1 Tax=Lipingzhangella halophila TaxID=1783352 RepID=A0A7W7RNU6_9ACTN|nr:histidine kinase [Lipingzhangella halophila]MBB4935448.1 two-component system sensor histidine kinase DesK [Lipingzhangella halophila]